MVCVYLYIYTSLLCVSAKKYEYMCIYIHMYIYVYIYMYMYMYIYIIIYTYMTRLCITCIMWLVVFAWQAWCCHCLKDSPQTPNENGAERQQNTETWTSTLWNIDPVGHCKSAFSFSSFHLNKRWTFTSWMRSDGTFRLWRWLLGGSDLEKL